MIKVSTSVRGISFLTTSLLGKPPKPFLQVFLPPSINNPNEAYTDVKGQTNKSMKRISTIESAREKSTPAASSHTTLAHQYKRLMNIAGIAGAGMDTRVDRGGKTTPGVL